MTPEQEAEYGERFRAVIKDIAASVIEPLQQRIEELESRVAALEPKPSTDDDIVTTADLLKPGGIAAMMGITERKK